MTTATLGGVAALVVADEEGLSCQEYARALDPVWPAREKDAGIKSQIQAAFLATGLSYAASAFERVSAILDRYAGQWTAMRIEVCQTPVSSDAQTESLVVKRMLCLERRRAQLAALTELFATGADHDLVRKAVQAANGLLPIDYCGDTEALEAESPPPEEPALRARVEAVESRVRQGLALAGRALALTCLR